MKPNTENFFKRLPIMPKATQKSNWLRQEPLHISQLQTPPHSHTLHIYLTIRDNTTHVIINHNYKHHHDKNIPSQLLHHTQHNHTPITVASSQSHTHRITTSQTIIVTHTLTLHQFLVLTTPATLQERTPTPSTLHCHYSRSSGPP